MKLLKETILNEDIWSLKKYYPKISDEQYPQLLALDPTYKGGDIAGNYCKWILSLANKGALTNLNHVQDILTRFHSNKNNLKTKDLGQFKSIDDLENYLNDQNNYKQLSQRQELRQTQKAVRSADVNQDAELIFEDSKWQVWVPHTYEASCKLGQGSHWCTASTSSDHYFRHYTSKGLLYININKSNPKEKYQFHFQTNSFMDIQDDTIDLSAFMKANPDLANFYRDKVIIKDVCTSNTSLDKFINILCIKNAIRDKKISRALLLNQKYPAGHIARSSLSMDAIWFWSEHRYDIIKLIEQDTLTKLGISYDEIVSAYDQGDWLEVAQGTIPQAFITIVTIKNWAELQKRFNLLLKEYCQKEYLNIQIEGNEVKIIQNIFDKNTGDLFDFITKQTIRDPEDIMTRFSLMLGNVNLAENIDINMDIIDKDLFNKILLEWK